MAILPSMVWYGAGPTKLTGTISKSWVLLAGIGTTCMLPRARWVQLELLPMC